MFDNDINARIGELDAELEGIAALTDPTDEDVARTETILGEIATLRAENEARAERSQRISAALTKAKTEGRTIAGSSFQHMQKVEPFEADLHNPAEARDAARAILDRPEAKHLDAESKEHADGLIGQLGSRMSRHTVLTMRPQYRDAFRKYISGREAMMTNEERLAVQAVEEARTALALADSTGGYAVPALLDPSVIYTGSGSANPMRQVARIVTGMDDTWRGVTSAGITASWDSEAIEVSDDSPTLGQATVVNHKASAFVQFSVELEGDWAGLAAEMGGLFQIAKDDLETVAFATGNGTSDRPYGILTDLFAASVAQGVLPTTDGAFGAVDVRAVFGALGPRYRPQASFMASIDAINEIRGFDTQGGLSNQTVDLTQPYNFAVLGRPVYENSGFPDFTGTTGAANILVVGDFKNYVIFDRVGSRVEFVPQVFGSSARRPTGQRGLYFWWRVGGKTVNTAAFKLLLNA